MPLSNSFLKKHAMGSRVFVRLFDGARALETDDVVLTLPPPPLKWPAVLGAMVAALDRADADADDDDDDAAAAATVAPERLARARLFLLPSEALGIVAEVRALRFFVPSCLRMWEGS